MDFVSANPMALVHAGVSAEQVERFLALASSVLEHLPEMIASIASLIAVWREGRAQSAATSAKQTAQRAQIKAEEAVREQINFARRAQVEREGAGGKVGIPTKGESE